MPSLPEKQRAREGRQRDFGRRAFLGRQGNRATFICWAARARSHEIRQAASRGQSWSHLRYELPGVTGSAARRPTTSERCCQELIDVLVLSPQHQNIFWGP